MNIEKVVYKSIESLVVSGVFSIRNDIKKKVYLGYTECLIETIGRITKEIKNGTFAVGEMIEDRDNLYIEMLECCNRKSSRIILANQLKQFMNIEYTEYRKTPKATLKVVKLVTLDGIVVVLRNTRGNDIEVGRFNSMVDADTFVSMNYPSTEITHIIYTQ